MKSGMAIPPSRYRVKSEKAHVTSIFRHTQNKRIWAGDVRVNGQSPFVDGVCGLCLLQHFKPPLATIYLKGV